MQPRQQPKNIQQLYETLKKQQNNKNLNIKQIQQLEQECLEQQKFDRFFKNSNIK